MSSNAPQGVKVERDFTGGAIFGICCAVLVGVALIIAMGWYCYKKKKQTGVSIGGSGNKDANYRYRDRLTPLNEESGVNQSSEVMYGEPQDSL